MSDNPLSFDESARYALVLRELLSRLDREVIFAAIFGERECDLLHSEREEVNSLREFLHSRVRVPFVLDGFRGRSLALLDAFEDELLSAKSHEAEPTEGAV